MNRTLEYADRMTNVTHSFDPQPMSRLLRWLYGRTFGETIVKDARSSALIDEDGAPAIYLSLTLSDPHDDSWPIDDVMSLQRQVMAKASEFGVSESIYLSFEPATDIPQFDDDELRYA